MKFFAVFAAVLALAAAESTTQWTLHQLDSALSNPATPAQYVPYLEAALNELMESAFSGKPLESIAVPTPAGLLPVEAVTPVDVAPAIVAEVTTQWTMNELSMALQNPATPAEYVPYLEAALNTLMEATLAGTPMESIAVPTPAGLLPVEAITPVEVAPAIVAEVTTQWTMHELSMALQNPATPAEYVPYLEAALNTLMEATLAGTPMESIAVPTPAGLLPVEAITPVEVAPAIVAEVTTQWTLHELSMALQNPNTPAEYVPYLEAALNTLMDAMFAGSPMETVAVPTPAGLLPVEAITPIEVSPVAVGQPEPVEIEAPEAPVAPAPVVIADASGSPLVQIIINIQSQEAVAPAPENPETVLIPEAPETVVISPSPVELPVAPAPVVIAPAPVELPEAPTPVVVAPSPVEVAPEVPEAVIIAPEVPEPVVIAPAPIVIAPDVPEVNPIDIIAVGAPEVNPMDLLQPVPVAVEAPEVNPIDLLQPVPVTVAGGAVTGILV